VSRDVRMRSGRQIIYVRNEADAQYWDTLWEIDKGSPRSSNAREFVAVSRRYLETGGRILEGGCGNGHIAVALQEAGYRLTALDWAERTVARVRSANPGMRTLQGDVRSLELSDGEFDGYWSLGVIEHFWDGYADILNEAYRVLKPSGYLFLTFPSMNMVRDLKLRRGSFESWNSSSAPTGFYQFALRPKAVAADVAEAGFEVVSISRRSGPKGFSDEFGMTGKSLFARVGRNMLGRLLVRALGHSCLIVARKPNGQHLELR